MYDNKKERLENAKQAWKQAELNNASPGVMENLAIEYAIAQSELDIEPEIKNTSSYGIMGKSLQKEPKNTNSYPLAWAFLTENEKERITTHYQKLPEELRALVEAALQDDRISLDMMSNPVFLRGEGHLYDRDTVVEMLKGKKEANYPNNTDKKFTEEDIIPCFSLIKAMRIMLQIIDGKEFPFNPVEVNSQPRISNASKPRFSPELIDMIEIYYQQSLQPKHQALFDAICRDYFTKAIIQNPVFLPNGYVYDNTTLAFLLESAGEQNEAELPCGFRFKREDITPCYMIEKVLEKLKAMIELRAQQMTVAMAKVNTNSSTMAI